MHMMQFQFAGKVLLLTAACRWKPGATVVNRLVQQLRSADCGGPRFCRLYNASLPLLLLQLVVRWSSVVAQRRTSVITRRYHCRAWSTVTRRGCRRRSSSSMWLRRRRSYNDKTGQWPDVTLTQLHSSRPRRRGRTSAGGQWPLLTPRGRGQGRSRGLTALQVAAHCVDNVIFLDLLERSQWWVDAACQLVSVCRQVCRSRLLVFFCALDLAARRRRTVFDVSKAPVFVAGW